MCKYPGMHMPWPVCGGQRTNCEVGPLLPPREFQGLNSGLRARWQACLPAKPSPWPLQSRQPPLWPCAYACACVYMHIGTDRQRKQTQGRTTNGDYGSHKQEAPASSSPTHVVPRSPRVEKP